MQSSAIHSLDQKSAKFLKADDEVSGTSKRLFFLTGIRVLWAKQFGYHEFFFLLFLFYGSLQDAKAFSSPQTLPSLVPTINNQKLSPSIFLVVVERQAFSSAISLNGSTQRNGGNVSSRKDREMGRARTDQIRPSSNTYRP